MRLYPSFTLSIPKSEVQYCRAIFLVSLLLYLFCLAPTVLWGDEAAYQAEAYLLRLAMTPDSHPLLLILAHPFTYLPFGDIAYRVNLSGAFFGALSLVVVFSITRYYTKVLLARVSATAILCLSHTFWEYSVRANPYSLTVLFFSLTWLLILMWKDTNKIKWLFMCCLVFLIGTAHHLLLLVTLPGFFIMLLPSLKHIVNRRVIFYFTISIIGLALLCFVIPPINKFLIRTYSIMWPAFWPPRFVTSTIISGFGMLLYNIQLSLIFCLFGLRILWNNSRLEAIGILVIVIADFIFTILLNLPPAYMYYLPIVVVMSVLCAPGIEFLKSHVRILSWPMILFAIVVIPVFVYRVTPMAMNKYNIQLPRVRDLPGRDAEEFYLWPPKNGVYGARLNGEVALSGVPHNSLIYADGTTAKTLWYLQDVDGLRKDVTVVIDIPLELQAEYLLVQNEKRPVFLADTQLYYNIAAIEKYFNLIPFGPIYYLQPRKFGDRTVKRSPT